MTSRSASAPGRPRRALAAALAVVLLAGLPVGAFARDPVRLPADPGTVPVATPDGGSPTAEPTTQPTAQPPAEPTPPPADPGSPAASPVPDLRPFQVLPGDEPSQMYEDAVAHEGRRFDFAPGGRVTLGFTPRADDHWPVGGAAPRALPAGRMSGREMAGAGPATADPSAAPDATAPPAPAATPAPAGDPSPTDAPAGSPSPATSGEPAASPEPTTAPADAPAATPDPTPVPAEGAALVVPAPDDGMSLAAVGMRREVYGFLPYWEVADSDTRLDFSVLTHVAYFSVGADSKGNLKKRNSDGSLTTGWAGWTSSKMTSVINAAHQKKSRVTLTISVFAWTSGQVAVQKALLGSASARSNLAKQAVAAVRNRGADGINLDFEPLVSGYEDEFVALVRTIRAEFSRYSKGYHVSFDTLGYPGNYPLESALAAGGADAVLVMGYDYRTAGASYAGSIDPLAGPAYDLTDTVRTYVARVPAGKVILGIPYYGRAWSTTSDKLNARTQTGAKYGYSNAVNYENAVEYAREHGRRYDSREVSAWVAYRKKNCTSAYGCVTTWRQIYYDDAATLRARYDLVNRSGLRGAGIWALGYDGTRTELYRALADKFLRDTTPPRTGIVAFPTTPQRDLGFVVKWTADDDWSGIAGYDVQVSADGGSWKSWLSGTKATSATYLGVDNHGYAFRVRAKDGKGNVSAWNVTSVFAKEPKLASGGFLRVVADTLNVRSAPDTGASRVATAEKGDVFAISGGPVSADGYTWYKVSGPITTWRPVGDVESSVWIAAASSSVTNAVAARAPNATLMQAMIRAVAFSGVAASIGSSTSAVGARSFSPNGDGSGDRLAIRWSNRVALDSLVLNVYRTDGTKLGSRPLPAADMAVGTAEYAWDGTAEGEPLADGRYVLQLVGTAGGATYTWPADKPTTGSLPSLVGVRIDRVAPTLVSASASGTRLSPNGNGKYEAMKISGSGSADVVRWEILVAPVRDGTVGDVVRRIAGSGRSVATSWNGKSDAGAVVRDGTYRVTLRLLDAAGNFAARSWTARVDTTPPKLAATAKPAAFSPNGDGIADTVRLSWTSGESMTGTLRVYRGTTLVRSWSVAGTGGGITWNGRDAAGSVVRDGRLRVVVAGADALANRSSAATALLADRTAGWLRWSPTSFFPQDRDALAKTSAVSVRLARTATVTLRILDAGGTEIRRPWNGRSFAAGTISWRWDGRTASGAWAPQGRYTAELTATSSLGTTVLRRSVYAGAFLATPSTTAPKAGSTFSVTFRSVEALGGTPRASFRQAGRSAVPMTVTRRSDGTWRASVVVAAGAPGAAVVTITARDSGGRTNRGTLTVIVR